jgi:ribosome-associated protein
MTTDTAAKKDTQRLQRAIIDGLEDVKAQDIQVFDTEHLSPLFERVVVASGTSNRQTKALAASVRDAVREAGFPKPRTEGEENGEWIIVDCGQAVVHVMQPNIRQYYRLEELWGEKPVRLKFGTDKPATKTVAKAPAKTTAAAKEAKPAPSSVKRSSAAKKGVMEAFPSKAQEKKTAAKQAAARAPAKKAAAKKTAAPAKVAAKSATSKPTVKVVGKATAKTPAKTVAKAATKTAAKKAPAKKTTSARKA